MVLLTSFWINMSLIWTNDLDIIRGLRALKGCIVLVLLQSIVGYGLEMEMD